MLITHGPPRNILDMAGQRVPVGCADLTKRLRKLRVKVHAFGHIHQSSGVLERDGTVYVNASICNVAYVPVNPPRVVII